MATRRKGEESREEESNSTNAAKKKRGVVDLSITGISMLHVYHRYYGSVLMWELCQTHFVLGGISKL